MTGIFYGSTTGNTESLAKEIASKLGVAASDIFDVGKVSADKVGSYDRIVLGSSTWGLGELQDDWYGFVEQLKKENLGGKKVALFGCGDSSSYPDTFCDAVGLIHEELWGSGCTFVGAIDAGGYSSTDSKAFVDGKAVGLLADDDDPKTTDAKMDVWVEAVKNA